MLYSKSFKKYAKYYDFFYLNKNYLKETKFISSFFKENKKKLNILDLGMGTGTHLINFLKKGHFVDGVEISQKMINIANKKIKKNNIRSNYNFFNQNILNFRGYKKKYDVTVLLFHVLNYLNNYSALKKIFKNTHSNLKNSGLLIFDCWNSKILKKEKLQDSKKSISFGKYVLKRNGIIDSQNKNKKIKIVYKFSLYKDDKLIQRFKETHNITSFSKKDIIRATKGKFKIINNCIWFNKTKKPQTKDFSSFFVLQKIN